MACGCSKRRVDAHGDGVIHLPITFRVIDAGSGNPMSGVSVTFYNEAEVAILRSIEVAKDKGRELRDMPPSGTTVQTTSDGRAGIRCRFGAAFLWSFQNGERKDVGTDVFPSGRIVCAKHGYVTLDQSAHEIFPSPPYSPKALEEIVTLRMKKEPNQSPQPTRPTGG
jgi:hypothetical protein